MKEKDMKKPHELNIMMVSMEKCGNSWFAACLSEIYEKTTGILVKWKHEISREIAVSNEFPLPEGWCSVYDVNPADLLKRNYDKILIVERNLEVLKRVFWLYHSIHDKKLRNVKYPHALKKYPQFFREIETYHRLVYAHDLNDPRIMRIYLEDLNNFTVDAFNEVLDFLNFPKKRSSIVPISPPERNWEAYPDLFPKGFTVMDKLKLIEYRYASNKIEAEKIENYILSRIRDDSININKLNKLEYKYGFSENPYKMSPREKEQQENKSFRIVLERNINDVLYMPKILVLGPRGYGIRAHFAENLHDQLIEFHHESVFLSSIDFKNVMTNEEWINHGLRREKIKLSSLNIVDNKNKEFKPDLIFIDEFDLRFDNDVNIPTFYNHKYLHRMLNCENPNAIFFCSQEYLNYYKKFISPETFKENVLQEILYPAVNNKIYQPTFKKVGGICGIGYRRSFDEWMKMGEIAKEPHIKIMEQEIDDFKRLGHKYYNTPINDEEYRDLLPTLDAIWFPIPRNQYISQRMLEAMACKTIVFILLESKRHEEFLREMGFVNGKHYVGMKSLREIENNLKKLNENGGKLRVQMANEAYYLVDEKHSYRTRTKEILAIYDACFNPYQLEREKTPKILNLGCGTAIMKDAINLDIANLPGVDVVHDLNEYPYPFEKSSFDTIIMDDVIEHVKEPIKCLKECHSLLKNHGEMRIKVVHWNHEYSYSDPTHLHAFGPIYWEFFTGKRRSYYMDYHFDDLEISYIFDAEAMRQFGTNQEELLKQARFHSNIIQAMNIRMYKGGKKQKLEVKESTIKPIETIIPKKEVSIPTKIESIKEITPIPIAPVAMASVQEVNAFNGSLLKSAPQEETMNLEEMDVIVPLYWIDKHFFEGNLNSWFKELPIKKLLIGINNEELYQDQELMKLLKNEKIEIIDQTHIKTLGKCLVELMKLVKTNYFIFLHSDVLISQGSFSMMKNFLDPSIGILESALRKNIYSDGHFNMTDENAKRIRAYSGFQIIKKKSIMGFINKVKDDLVYRNEDLLMQYFCMDAGYRYEKCPALHEHQLTNSTWSMNKKEAMEMQWKGLVKYASPSQLITQSLIPPLKICLKEYRINWSEILSFVESLKNAEWNKFFYDLLID